MRYDNIIHYQHLRYVELRYMSGNSYVKSKTLFFKLHDMNGASYGMDKDSIYAYAQVHINYHNIVDSENEYELELPRIYK